MSGPRIGDLNRAYRVGLYAATSSRNPFSHPRMRLYFERGRADRVRRAFRAMANSMRGVIKSVALVFQSFGEVTARVFAKGVVR